MGTLRSDLQDRSRREPAQGSQRSRLESDSTQHLPTFQPANPDGAGYAAGHGSGRQQGGAQNRSRRPHNIHRLFPYRFDDHAAKEAFIHAFHRDEKTA